MRESSWDHIESAVGKVAGSCEIISCIKTSPDSDVFVAMVDETKVVIKKFHAKTADTRVREMKAELDFATQKMATGRNQINQCLHIVPDSGIAVLSFVPGEKVSVLIKRADAETRAKLISHSAQWLREYTLPRRELGAFGPWHWIRQLRKIDTLAVTHPDDLELLSALLTVLEQRAGQIAKCDVMRAAGHGDFAGINLHYHDDVMYGVDIQTQSWYATANEAARYLVFLQIHNSAIFDETRFGIAQNDWVAFHDACLIGEIEQQTTLPFFIGVHLYRRMVGEIHRRQISDNISHAIERYLLDMARLG